MRTLLPYFDKTTYEIVVEVIVDDFTTHRYKFPCGTDLMDLPGIEADVVERAQEIAATNWTPALLSSMAAARSAVEAKTVPDPEPEIYEVSSGASTNV